MADAPGVGLAFAAGTVSFLSPCCLPLVPGYLATVSGMDLKAERRRVDPRVLGRSALFVGVQPVVGDEAMPAHTCGSGRVSVHRAALPALPY